MEMMMRVEQRVTIVIVTMMLKVMKVVEMRWRRRVERPRKVAVWGMKRAMTVEQPEPERPRRGFRAREILLRRKVRFIYS